jgi:hypothetical protein
MLFDGFFFADIPVRGTRVELLVFDDYTVIARFSHNGRVKEFNIKKWTNTDNLRFFAGLVTEKFPQCDQFGTTRTEYLDGGGYRMIIDRSRENLLNIVKYAIVDVFTCAEQIVSKNRNSVIDYAIFHRELGNQSTYEEYIHLMACICLIQSKYQPAGYDYPLVDFCTEEQMYDEGVLERIASLPEGESD